MADEFDFDAFSESLVAGASGKVRAEKIKRGRGGAVPLTPSAPAQPEDTVFDREELQQGIAETFSVLGDIAHSAWETDAFTDKESERLGKAWAPVAEKYLAEWLRTNSIWIPAILTTTPLLGKRVIQGVNHARAQKAAQESNESSGEPKRMKPEEF